MRSVERDFRLLILAASAGSADGWSYFGFGHAFVANMTGNTVLLGLAVFQDHGDVLHLVISLGCYALGAMLGSLLTGSVRPDTVWPRAISRTLLLEALLLLAATALLLTCLAGLYPVPTTAISRYCAQGQAGARAVRRLRITPLGTPGLSFVTASARASIKVSISARRPLMRSSSVGRRVAFIGFGSFGRFRRWLQKCQLLPGDRGLVLRTPQRLFTLGFMGCDIDLQIVGQRFEALLAIVGP